MTKYLRQIKFARQRILRAGMLVTWLQPGNTDSTNDPSAEFPTGEEPVAFEGTPIVFYPQKSAALQTQVPLAPVGTVQDQLFALIPGDVPFTPKSGDFVVVDGQTLTVDKINVLKPDFAPIVYELSFK